LSWRGARRLTIKRTAPRVATALQSSRDRGAVRAGCYEGNGLAAREPRRGIIGHFYRQETLGLVATDRVRLIVLAVEPGAPGLASN
jgi:hypothetical protein